MTLTSSAADRARGRMVPWVIAGFFLAFMLPLMGFVWIAFQNQPSEVTAHAYDKGLAYNRTLQKASAQAELGWKAEIAPEDGQLRVLLVDRDNAPLKGARIQVWFQRPANAKLDRQAIMREVVPGRYEAALASLAPGLWEAHITVWQEGKQFQAAQSFNLQ